MPSFQTIIYWNLHTINRWKTWKIEKSHSVSTGTVVSQYNCMFDLFLQSWTLQTLNMRFRFAYADLDKCYVFTECVWGNMSQYVLKSMFIQPLGNQRELWHSFQSNQWNQAFLILICDLAEIFIIDQLNSLSPQSYVLFFFWSTFEFHIKLDRTKKIFLSMNWSCQDSQYLQSSL